MLISTSRASVMLQMVVRLLLSRGLWPGGLLPLVLFGFFIEWLSCSDVGCSFLQVLHVCLSLQWLAMCWLVKQPKHSFFSLTNSHYSVRDFFKNWSNSSKLWGLLHKVHAKVRRLLFSCFKPVAKLVSLLFFSDPPLNLRYTPLSGSMWWGLLIFSSENTGSVASSVCSCTNCENSSKSAILPSQF